MIVYPAIDLSEGALVRLYQGDFAAKTVYSHEPLEIARGFQHDGAEWVHIVDLDGAREGVSAQTDAILELARGTGLKVQVGGGVRDSTQISRLLDGGIDRVVVGSRAVDHPEEVRAWISSFGADRLALAFDVRHEGGVPFPATRGWQAGSTTSLWDLLGAYDGSGLRHLLCTDIERDGTLAGPNAELYAAIRRRFPRIEVQASGGVSALDDLRALKRMRVAGAIEGRALYEKGFVLSEALAC